MLLLVVCPIISNACCTNTLLMEYMLVVVTQIMFGDCAIPKLFSLFFSVLKVVCSSLLLFSCLH